LKSTKTNSNLYILNDKDEIIVNVVSECLFSLINFENIAIKDQKIPSNNSETESDNESELKSSTNKKRKIEKEYFYSWSYLVSQIDGDMDLPNKLCWINILRNFFKFNFNTIPKNVLVDLITNFVLKSLNQIDVKSAQLNDNQLRINFLNRSSLHMFSELLKNINHDLNHELFNNKIEYLKLFNFCIVNQSHPELVGEFLRLEPRFIKNLVTKFFTISEKLDMFHLSLISKSKLNSLDVLTKSKLIDFVLSYESENDLEINFNNYDLIYLTLVKCLDLEEPETKLESLDTKFLFGKNISDKKFEYFFQYFFENKIEKKDFKSEDSSRLPNFGLLDKCVQIFHFRLRENFHEKNLEHKLSEFFLLTKILDSLKDLKINNLDELKSELKTFANDLFGQFDVNENLDQTIQNIKEIYLNFTNLSKKEPFLDALGSKIIEKCLKILEIPTSNEKLIENFSYLEDQTKLGYLKLLTFGLLCNLSIEYSNIEAYTKIGLNLKLKLFKYINSNKSNINENYLVIFLIHFMRNNCNYLEFNEYEICLKWFNTIINGYDNYTIRKRVLITELFGKYFQKILINSVVSENESELPKCQELFVKIVDKHFLTEVNSIELNLKICEIYTEILKLMRIHNLPKKDILGYFSKIYNQFITSPNQSIIVKNHAITLLSQVCFNSPKSMKYEYLFEMYQNKSSYLDNLIKINQDEEEINHELENGFFDRIYSNLVLNNKIFEHEFNNIFSIRSKVERNMSADEKYSNFRKIYSGLKKSISEPVMMKFLVRNFFSELFQKSKFFDQKFLVKCIFGLIQISSEFNSHFSIKKVEELFSNICNFKNSKSDLVEQWMQIYLTEKDDCNDLNNLIRSKFPIYLFNYNDLVDFYKNHIQQFVIYLIEKFQIKIESVLDREYLENFKPNIYSGFLSESLLRNNENFNLNLLLKSRILNADYLKKNFYRIFELTFFGNFKIADLENSKITNCINSLVQLYSNDPNKSENLYKLLGGHPYYLFKIIFNLNNQICQCEKDTDLMYAFDLFQIFVQSVILPLDEASFNLISNLSDNCSFINEFILHTLINSLKISIKKIENLKAHNSNDKIFLDYLYETSLFTKDFIIKIFNLFFTIVRYLDNSFNRHDYQISCVIWYIMDFLNKYLSFGIKIEFMDELNMSLFKNIINFLIKYSRISDRLKRQLKFLFIQRNFSLENSCDNSVKDILMLNLKSFGELSDKYEDYLKYDFDNEVRKCLSSLDFDKNLTFKYILCYLVSLTILEFKKENYNFEIKSLKSMTKIVIDKLSLIDGEHRREIEDLVSIMLSKIGPICIDGNFDDQEYSNFNEKRKIFIVYKFNYESNHSIYSFYLNLCQKLMEFLTDQNSNMQLIGHKLLEQIFSTPESREFLQEYEKYSQEFNLKMENEEFKELISTENFQNLSIDYFSQFVKMFNKNEIKSLSLTTDNDDETNFNILKIADLWLLRKKTYFDWLKNLALNLLNTHIVRDNIYEISSEALTINVSICELFVKNYLKQIILLNSNVSSLLGDIFNKIFQMFKNNGLMDSETKKYIQIFLEIIDSIRIDYINRKKNCLFWVDNEEFWKNLNFLFLAQTSYQIGQNYSAIYFIEIWFNQQIKDKSRGFKNTNIEILKSEPIAIEVLLSCFRNIGESNALDSELIYFIESAKQLNFMDYENSDDCLNLYDNYLSRKDSTENVSMAKKGLIKALRNKGLSFLMENILNNGQSHYENGNSGSDSLENTKYMNAFKMSLWNEQDIKVNSSYSSFKQHFSECLNSMLMMDNDNQNLDLVIKNTNENIEKCKKFLIEELVSKKFIHNEANNLMIQFYQLEELKNSIPDVNNSNELDFLDHVMKNLNKYSRYESKFFSNNIDSFYLFDDLLSLRVNLGQKISFKNDQEKNSTANTYIGKLFQDIVDNSINFKRFEIGQLYINEMRSASKVSKLICDIKEAELLYSKCNLKKAKYMLKNSLENFESSILKNSQTTNSTEIASYIKALDLYGHLLNETKSENPTVIIRDLFEKSVYYIGKFNLDSQTDKFDLIVDSFFSLAKFADTQYQNICDYVKSKSFEEHAELMKKFQQESNKTKIIDPTSQFNFILHKQYDIDREEMRNLLENKEIYLCKAIKYYLYCLELGSNQKQDSYSVFRIVSLWTQNSSNLNVNKTVAEKLMKISTYKFLILIHQLAARMSLQNLNLENSNNPDDLSEKLFQSNLIQLVTKICQEHPHQCLPVLFAFSNSHKDFLLSKSQDQEVNNYLKTEDRVNTSNYILNNLRKLSESMRLIIESLGQVCEAYIELANTQINTRPRPNESLIIPKNLFINKINNFNLTNVLTNRIELNINGNYEEEKLIYIVKFDQKFKIANGVNMPKIIHCLGSDGILRKQLVKGRDDLRQDAVMQQFFATVNDLITFNNNSRNTVKLNTMRTYKIIPLSQKSGVLEWCQNTITIGNWLIGENQDGGAHKKYEPNDLRFDECKRILHEACQQNDDFLSYYQTNCAKSRQNSSYEEAYFKILE
ncbi:unnamed protein product, partial [Brachionus calyciflorus]